MAIKFKAIARKSPVDKSVSYYPHHRESRSREAPRAGEEH